MAIALCNSAIENDCMSHLDFGSTIPRPHGLENPVW